MSEDPYHTEFVSWRVDHFLIFHFFSTRGGVRRLVENSNNFFLTLSLVAEILDPATYYINLLIGMVTVNRVLIDRTLLA